MFKVNKNMSGRRQYRRSVVFLLTLNGFNTWLWYFIVDFEQVNDGWVNCAETFHFRF